MKNKKSVYGLGLAVLVIWGLILQKIFQSMADDQPKLAVAQRVEAKEAFNDYSFTDSTALLLNYPDPFGLSDFDTIPVENERTKKNVVIPDSEPEPEPEINWDMIRYSGFIHNPGSGKLIAILNINGKNLMMAEGDTAEEMKLIKHMQDSVKVSYRGKVRMIKLSTLNI